MIRQVNIHYLYFLQVSLTSRTCWQYFVQENLTVTLGFFLLILWQSSRRSVGILDPILSKMTTFFSSKASAFTWLGIPIMYAHSRLEYCAFNQHWFSILTSLLDRRVLICFVKDILACNLEKDSLYWRISTRTLLFTS